MFSFYDENIKDFAKKFISANYLFENIKSKKMNIIDECNKLEIIIKKNKKWITSKLS